MSTPIDSSLNSPNGSSNEVGRGQMSEAAAGRLASDFRGGDKFASVVPDGGDSAQIATADVFQGEPARLRLGASRSCLFHVAPAPPLRRRRSWLGVMDRVEKLIVAVVVGAIVAGQSSFSALSQQVSDRPRLVGWASPLAIGEPVSLGLTLQGRANDAVVMISGLVPGMTLSIGSKIGVATWQVPATALPNVWIVPPTNFIGVADLVAELHLADRTTLDRQRIKLEWLAAIPAGGATGPTVATDRAAVAPPHEQTVTPSRHRDADESPIETDRTAVAPPYEQTVTPSRHRDADEPPIETDRTAVAPPHEQTVTPSRHREADEPTVETDRTAVAPPHEQTAAPTRQLDPDEVAALLKRGEALMRNGDLAAARVVLQRAAEAKSAEAALTLGKTYDPVILRELKVYSFASDVAMARSWYEKAKELGSPEAPRRLEILARAAR